MCPTQPRVLVTNITVQNLTSTGGLTLPGVILCNASRPCTNLRFTDVAMSGPFEVQKEYVCENADMVFAGTVSPQPHCNTTRDGQGGEPLHLHQILDASGQPRRTSGSGTL